MSLTLVNAVNSVDPQISQRNCMAEDDGFLSELLALLMLVLIISRT